MPFVRVECLRLVGDKNEQFDVLISVVAFLLVRLKGGDGMEDWGVVIGGIIGGVFILMFFFGMAFAPQIAAYLEAKIEGIRLKNQREPSLTQTYQDGYNKGYKDGLRDRFRRRRGEYRD